MSAEPIEVVRRLYDAWNRGDVDAGRELIAPDVVNHAPASGSMPDHPPGEAFAREAWLAVWPQTRAFFPDMHTVIEDYAQNGDLVAVRCVVHGTHTVDYHGIPPTGKPYAMPMMAFSRVRDGQIVEHWAISDNLMLVAQLGGELPHWVLGRDAEKAGRA